MTTVADQAAALAAAVGEVLFESEHKVMAPVEHAEPRTSSSSRRYLPRSIEVRWVQNTDHEWRCGYISLYGPQIRKDGSLGSRELHEAIWTFPDGTPKSPLPWTSSDPAPAWAAEFCRSSRPMWGETR